MLRILTTLLFLLLCPLSAPLAQESAAPTEPGRKIALLVGIGEYPRDVELRQLPGAQNDPALIKRLLVDRFGFRPEDIRILLNEEATHENIVLSFHQWLIQRADQNTEAVFWYSGHGSLTADRSGIGLAERDDQDSTLVAWDSRLYAYDGAYDIIDDELGSLIRALARKTKKITVVTDSCHSGGVTRGGQEGVVRGTAAGKRSFDWELIEDFWPEDIPYVEDDPSDPASLPYVHIAACGPTQLAREYFPSQQTKPFGGLTYFLFYRMQSLNPGDTYRDLIGSADTWIKCYLTGQSIHFSGDVDRHVFGDDYEQRPPGFTAHANFSDTRTPTREVGIDAGEMNGLRVGTVLRLRDYDGTEVGTATVQHVFAATASATLDGDPPAEFGARGLMATEVSRPGGQPPLKILVSNDLLADRIEADMGSQIRVLRKAEGGPTHRIDVDPKDAGADDAVTLSFRDPAGALIRSEHLEKQGDDSWVDQFLCMFKELLEAEWQYLGILEITRMDRGFDIACSFKESTEDELEKYGAVDGEVRPLSAVEVGAPGGKGKSNDFAATFNPDEKQLLMLEVSNNTDEPLCFSILSVTEAREIFVILPQRGQELQIPAHGQRRAPVQMTRPPGFEAERPMRDRYVVIATRKQTNFYPHVQRTTLRGDMGIPPIIANALSWTVTRGGDPPVEVEGKPSYGIATADLLVLSPSSRK
ncbi:MAG: caspase family protein [Planctomycetota bacterium]